MVRCPGIKRDGSRCTVTVDSPQTYCWWHDPANAEERKRAAARGGKRAGRGRPLAELAQIKELLKDLTERVLGQEGTEPLETGQAAVANQLINTRLRAIEQERKIKETEDLEARIEALERTQEQEKGARKWRGAYRGA
jgi:hypothetical protein